MPAADVMAVGNETGAIPCDIPGVDMGHVGELCSFDAFIPKYHTRRRPSAVALIVRDPTRVSV